MQVGALHEGGELLDIGYCCVQCFLNMNYQRSELKEKRGTVVEHLQCLDYFQVESDVFV